MKIDHGWPEVVSGVAIDIRDGTHDTPEYVTEGVPLVTSKNLRPSGIDFSNVGFISSADHQSISRRSRVDNGDIIYGMIGTIGNPVIAHTDKEFSIKNVGLFKFAGSPYHNRFFKHLLLSSIVQRQIDKATRGGTQKFVSLGVLRNLTIPLPPLPEQKRIAAILDQADALREKRRQAIAKLDELLLSVFLDMFGDPVTNPKGWKGTRLGNFIIDGPQNGLYKPARDYGTGTPILRIDGFYDGVITDASSLKRVRLSSAEIENYSLHEGDIIINRVNSRPYLGKSALVTGLKEQTVFESNMMRFRVESRFVEPEFLVDSLQSTYIKNQILRQCKDAVNQSSINQHDVKFFSIRVPPIDRQKEFLSRKVALKKIWAQAVTESTELNTLFASLQQKAFKGNL